MFDGSDLKRVRESVYGMTQRQLCEAVGYEPNQQATISQWERGARPIPKPDRYLLLAFFGEDLEERHHSKETSAVETPETVLEETVLEAPAENGQDVDSGLCETVEKDVAPGWADQLRRRLELLERGVNIPGGGYGPPELEA